MRHSIQHLSAVEVNRTGKRGLGRSANLSLIQNFQLIDDQRARIDYELPQSYAEAYLTSRSCAGAVESGRFNSRSALCGDERNGLRYCMEMILYLLTSSFSSRSWMLVEQRRIQG